VQKWRTAVCSAEDCWCVELFIFEEVCH
jgi:hypothetical protein